MLQLQPWGFSDNVTAKQAYEGANEIGGDIFLAVNIEQAQKSYTYIYIYNKVLTTGRDEEHTRVLFDTSGSPCE